MAWQDLKFSLDVGAEFGDAQISIQLGARSRFRGAPAAVVAAVHAAWDPRRALAVEGDGPHGLRAWATPDDKEAVTKELLAVCAGLGLAAEEAPVPEAAPAGANLAARLARYVVGAVGRSPGACRVTDTSVALGVDDAWLAARDAAREARRGLLDAGKSPRYALVDGAEVRVDSVEMAGTTLSVKAAARPVVVRVGGAPLAALERLDGAGALARVEAGDDAFGDTVARLFPDLATPRRVVGFAAPYAKEEGATSLAAMSRARGYDAWRPRTASEDAAFWARRSGLARLPPPPPTGPTHVLLEHEELPAPRALIVGEAVAVRVEIKLQAPHAIHRPHRWRCPAPPASAAARSSRASRSSSAPCRDYATWPSTCPASRCRRPRPARRSRTSAGASRPPRPKRRPRKPTSRPRRAAAPRRRSASATAASARRRSAARARRPPRRPSGPRPPRPRRRPPHEDPRRPKKQDD